MLLLDISYKLALPLYYYLGENSDAGTEKGNAANCWGLNLRSSVEDTGALSIRPVITGLKYGVKHSGWKMEWNCECTLLQLTCVAGAVQFRLSYLLYL